MLVIESLHLMHRLVVW